LEREPKRRIPPSARYPLFLAGLLILIVGELVALSVHAGVDTEAGVGALGYVVLVLSVALR
jgi:hypothetical protein